MTIGVGVNTAVGSYPITVTASGGGLSPTTTVTLMVTSGSQWQQGFNFRATAGYVSDPSNTTHVLATTAYPTKVGGVTFGWLSVQRVASRDRSTQVDPRLAGVDYANNGAPATFSPIHCRPAISTRLAGFCTIGRRRRLSRCSTKSMRRSPTVEGC